MEFSHSLVNSTMQQEEQHMSTKHMLSDEWCFWAHLPHDTDWSLNSYKNIYNLKTAEDVIALNETLPCNLVTNCMLFIMRKGITPLWEDPKNRAGGCFSYKVNNKIVIECWKSLSYALLGETLLKNSIDSNLLTGISISPKKNFCVIKIWFQDCSITDPNIIIDIEGLESDSSIFKKHIN